MFQECKMDILLVFILTCWLTSDLHASMVPCSTDKYQGPQLPTLPDQFTVNIEASIVQKHYSMNIKEYYDYPNNRGMIERYDPKTGEKVRVVIDLVDNSSHVYYMNQTCTVLPISSSNTFGFLVGSNGSHIKSVKDLLHFGDDMGEQYIGQETVRGIVANHWRACVNLPKSNGTFNLDYYFSVSEGFYINGMLKTVPLRAVINGTAKSLRNGSVSDDYHSFYHVYEFVDFQPGPITDTSVFEIPVGTYCENSLKSKSMPLVPDQFTVSMETQHMVADSNNAMQNQQVFYDGQTKLIRVDGAKPKGPQGKEANGKRGLTVIVDYTTNLQYTLDTWEQNCSVSMVTNSPSSQSEPMFQPGHFLDMFKGNYTYQGQKTVRGVKTESWALLNQTSKIITEIFFHKVNAPMGPVNLGLGGGSKAQVSTQYVLVGISKRSLSQATGERPSGVFMHMYNFMAGHPDPEVYDVSTCYEMGHHYSYMAFKTEGNYRRDVNKHRREFTSAVRSAVARGAKVSGTRVTSILIEEDPNNNNQLRVFFKILDNQLDSIKFKPAQTGPSLDQAKLNLQQSVSAGLNFDVQYPTIEKNFQVISDTLWVTMSSDVEPQQSTLTRYSAGSMAGIAIGMLVVGALLGLLAAFVIYKRVDTSVPYQVTQ